MLEAIEYQKMLMHIKNNEVKEDTIGILITRPDLDAGMNIIKGLPYYHNRSGYFVGW